MRNPLQVPFWFGALFISFASMSGCESDSPVRTQPQQSQRWSQRFPIDRGGSFQVFQDAPGVFRAVTTPGSRIYLYASVNGSPPAKFIMDTGAPTTFVTRSRITGQWSGTPTTAVFPLVGGAVPAWNSYVSRFAVVGPSGNSVYSDNFPITVIDCPALDQEGVAGLIGDDFLSKFHVTIDYWAREITFSQLEPPFSR
jgi:hypothetical protein